MIRLVVSSSRCWRVLRWVGLAATGASLWACTSRTMEAPIVTPSVQRQWTFTQKINNNLDILFMIDNSKSMTDMQQKLLAQLPSFMNVLETLQVTPNLHVAVVSSDMGAKSDTALPSCTPLGNQGEFFSQPEGTCLATTLTAGDTFISDVDGVSNFTDPIASVFQCIGFLGANGCGFEHQLASIDRALGADGLGPVPSTNAGFLRPDAYLGIVMLTNEDDCSAPTDTTIYSLNRYPESITNPDGPIADYRCNGGPRGGHLCRDPNSQNGTYATPPLTAPSDATGSPTMLPLADCKDNDSGSSALTPVSKFVSDIKALKPDPDSQILVGEIVAPAAPYAVEWIPTTNPQTGATEPWPQVMHSCGAAGGPGVNPDPSAQTVGDGSFGDPGVREAEFAHAFKNSVLASICDADYSQSMTQIAAAIGHLITPPCIESKIQNDANGNPDCSVIENRIDASGNQLHQAIQNCNENGNTAPCWTLVPGTNGCNGQSLKVTDTAAGMMSSSEDSTVSCSLCMPGVAAPGC